MYNLILDKRQVSKEELEEAKKEAKKTGKKIKETSPGVFITLTKMED